MKLIQGFVVFLLFFAASCASNQAFLSDNFQSQAQLHQRIAILPFQVQFNEEYKNDPILRRNGMGGDATYWKEQERLAGLDLQKEFFIAIAKEVEKGRIEKAIQDFLTTNKLLAEAGVNIYQLPKANKADLCRILGVDAIISGDSKVEVFPNGRYSFTPGGATTETKLFDAQTGEMLWQKSVQERPNSRMDTPKRLGTMAVQSLVKMLPYRQKR